jgi:hypothetical protein
VLRDSSGITAAEFQSFTLREIAAVNDAREMREIRTDFETARIVAMVAASNSKRRRYDPAKYMIKAHRDKLRDMNAEIEHKKLDPARGMTGEQVLQAFRGMGVPIIDKRKKK